MRSVAVAMACTLSLIVQVPAALAQVVTVQEPSLETFGLGTTVSVPDRGRASLGGVRRSASSRSVYGPLRRGTSMGFSRQGAGLGVEARIQDLTEMDRAVLETAESSRKARNSGRLSESAEHAYETLQSGRNVPDGAKTAPVGAGAKEPGAPSVTKADQPAGPSTCKLLDRARQAESAGKSELALAFLKAARDRGSSDAQSEIDRLTRKMR